MNSLILIILPTFLLLEVQNLFHKLKMVKFIFFLMMVGVMSLAGWQNSLYMFGGYSNRSHLNDFYVFNFATNTWRKVCGNNESNER